jgi:membrane-anchored protein YejM (alkaline phosphatase superfamily)
MYQGTPLRPNGSPILNLKPTKGITPEHQRANLDLLRSLNDTHAKDHPAQSDLRARMESYELAFRMQAEVPDLVDLKREPQATLDLYGIGREPTDEFGRKCLLARRLVEKGVRFVQLYAGSWDSHDYIERAHTSLVRRVDQPIAGLIQDLKRTGLLKDTLVMWAGEFGRSPDNGVRMGTAFGRDHNPKAMTIWFAGGGVKAGHTIGKTDELGAEAVECVHHIRDLHVTQLHLLGLDDARLTYYHGGRYKQLSQFGGQVIRELIA